MPQEQKESEVEPQKDEYGDAFEEATTGTEKVVEKPEGEGDKPKEEKEEANVEVKDNEVVEDKGTERQPEESDKKLKDLEQKYRSLQGMYNKLVKNPDDKGETKPPAKENEPPEEATAEDINTLLVPFFETLYSDVDGITKKALKDYEEEFDIPSKVEDVKRNHSLKKTIQFMEKRTDDKLKEGLVEFAKAVKDYIQPLVGRVEQSGKSEHYAQIKSAHPDFETYRDNGELKDWVTEQPKLLRDTFERTMKNGSAEDIISMYDMFKKDKGLIEKKKDDADEEEVTKITTKKDEKIKNLEMVKSKSSGVNVSGTGKAEGYEDAFDEAITKANRR